MFDENDVPSIREMEREEESLDFVGFRCRRCGEPTLGAWRCMACVDEIKEEKPDEKPSSSVGDIDDGFVCN